MAQSLPLSWVEVAMMGSKIGTRALTGGWIVIAGWALPTAAQLSADWMIPAAAHNPGVRGTYWVTDLSLHNPHEYDLSVVVQALPSETNNDAVPTLDLVLSPWQTVNLWDVLGPDVFDLDGTAAILAYANPTWACDPIESCHFLVTSRTYTPDAGGAGEFGLTVAGAGVERATNWESLAYAAGILNDGRYFRCNVGIASWTAGWTTVRLDVQDAAGSIIESEFFDVPPFGHVQRRLATPVEGGSLVYYLQSGPDSALIFPYAIVINQETGDPSYFFAEASSVGSSLAGKSARKQVRPERPANGG
jgi:hypothetical protein